MHSSREPVIPPSCARRANTLNTLKTHSCETSLLSHTLHFPCPQVREFRDLNLCFHLDSRQAWEPLAEVSLPVFSGALRGRLRGRTIVIASPRSRGLAANSQVLGLWWRSWASDSSLCRLVPGGGRLLKSSRGTGAVSTIRGCHCALASAVGRTWGSRSGYLNRWFRRSLALLCLQRRGSLCEPAIASSSLGNSWLFRLSEQ